MKLTKQARNVVGCKLCLSLGVAFLSFGVVAAEHNVCNVTELTNAIARAASGDTIVLAAGRYDLSSLAPYVHGDLSWGTMSTPDASAGKSCLWFNRKLIIKGADTTPWSEKTNGQESILDGGGVASIVYVYTGYGRNSSFWHLTFENGAAESGKSGGGIYAAAPSGNAGSYGGDGIVTNCVFRNCAAQNGGGTYAYTVYDSLYENCAASNTGCGGGAYGTGNNYSAFSTTNRFDGCVFRSCSANRGGGIYFEETRELTGDRAGYVANCVFTNCTADMGGALYENQAGMVRGCRFSCNSSNAGAVYANNTFSSILTNCTFEGNVSIESGGAVGRWNQVVGCSFTGNVATNDGGAVVGCTLAERCGFTNNVALCVGTASQGGGALSDVTARSCIFRGNASTKYAGALYSGNASNCVFEANTSTNQGGACYSTAATDCLFAGNNALGQRGGAMSRGTATRCAFTNNYCYAGARGAACAFVNARGCTFSGAGDVSCGSYTLCTFDGVASGRYVFDSVRNSGASLAVTNCLVVNNNVDLLVNNEGQCGEFVNCTFADNTIGNSGSVVKCDRGTDYRKKADSNEYRYYPGTNTFVNCVFSGNRHGDGTDADLALWKYTEETDFGLCSLQFANCLYTAGVENMSHADVLGAVQGSPRFVAGDVRFPDVPHYAIRFSSRARNAGANAAWMADAVDMAGNARINDGTVDIGCYEYYPLGDGMMLIFR